MNKTSTALLALALSTVGLMAYAQAKFDEDFDDKDKSWQEIAVQIPAAPKQENLLPFFAGPTSNFSFAIDAKSLSIGLDGVVRYTLLAKSSGGAENISYEGIRCLSMEKKVYAFGHKDGRWTRSRRDQWEPISRTVANAQHATLARDFFCMGQVVSGSADEILERIRWNKPLQQEGRYR
ncbi:MAG: CNP1-like family protein [Burkholderiales bacterium]|nr:CNP1-like family protein [Burkholderiales bacterium]